MYITSRARLFDRITEDIYTANPYHILTEIIVYAGRFVAGFLPVRHPARSSLTMHSFRQSLGVRSATRL